MEFVIYSLLFLVLIAFIGIIGYIIYDNYTYKDNLTTDLNTNFIDINHNFHSTSNIMRRIDKKHISNYNELDEKIKNTSNILDQRIYDTSNLLDRRIYDTSNILDRRIDNTSNLLHINSTKRFDTFGYNMNKYFAFNNTNSANAFDVTNRKIFEYSTLPTDINSRLELITKTTAKAGLKINSDSNNAFEVCNSGGGNCFNMYGNDKDLYIYGTNADNTKNNIYIGSNDKNTAPIRIENSIVKVNNVDVSALRKDVDTLLRSSSTTKASAAEAVKIATDAQTEASKKAGEAVTAASRASTALITATTDADTALATKATADAEVTRTAKIVSDAGAGATTAQRNAAENAVTAQTTAATNVGITAAAKTTAIGTKATADAEVIRTAAVKKAADDEVARTAAILASFG
jgi:hypothetical protein